MYVSIRRYKVQSGGMPEIVSKVKDIFTKTIKNAPGFNAYYLLSEGQDLLATVSVFDSKEHAEASNQLAAEFIRANNLSRYLANPPEITAGKLEVHEQSGSGLRTSL